MSDVEVRGGIRQKSSVPAFRLIVFQNIPETYLFDQPVTCTFAVDSSFSVSAQDLVGLYKVGWRSVNDSVSVAHVELPLKEGVGTVTFKDVPKDDEEFYQFCYVSSTSHVQGASSPFQFVTDDFEIIGDVSDASLGALCKEFGVGERVGPEEEIPSTERRVPEGDDSLEGPCAAGNPLEERLSELMERNRTLVEELTSLKMKLTESQILKEEEEERKFVDGLEKLSLTGASKDDLEDGTEFEATSFGEKPQEEFWEAEKTLYPMKTWFHNPYSHYIPANITDFSSIRVVTSELWPNNETVPGGICADGKGDGSGAGTR